MDKTKKTVLQKTLKRSLRRCRYRRWIIEVKGRIMTIKVTTLERMYRGNTPYPVSRSKTSQSIHAEKKYALVAMRKKIKSKREQGYSKLPAI